MAVQTVRVVTWAILDPFAVAEPFFYETGEEFDIDDDGWVAFHSSPEVNNVVVIPP